MKNIVKDTLAHWRSHNASRMGAALSYYAVFSLVPLLILLITIASALFNKDIVQQTLTQQLTSTIGAGGAHYIGDLLQNKHLQNSSVLSAILSIITLIAGALGIFTELDSDLDELWESTAVAPKRKRSFVKKILGLIRDKLITISLIPLLGILLISSIGITVFLAVIKASALFPLTILISFLQIVVPLILSTALFMLIYKILPNRKVPWKIVLVGGLATSVLFIIGNILIGIYIKLLANTSTFGGASSLVGLLVWTYYSAQVFFLGASFTFVLAKKKHTTVSRD